MLFSFLERWQKQITMKNGQLPAFAVASINDVGDGIEQEGLTKREYFAAKAMQGYAGGEFTGQSGMPCEQIAEWSVRMADALVYELAKKEKDLKD